MVQTNFDDMFDKNLLSSSSFVIIDDWKTLRESPPFWFSLVVDIFFVCDMVLNFFLKVHIKTLDRETKTLRTRNDITSNYLLGWFSIDLVSIIPVDLIVLAINTDNSGNSAVDALKLVRLLRLLKLLRLLRASRMIARWSDQFPKRYF